jgi:DNA-binding response OmpR family regulator
MNRVPGAAVGLPATATVVLVGLTEPDQDYLQAEGLNLGAYDVLARPFDRADVMRTVCLAREQWRNRYVPKVAMAASVS